MQDSHSYQIVKDHFQLLIRRRVPELSRKLSQPTEIIHRAIEKIAELDPAPGRRFSEDTNQSVSADATVERVGDDWSISLNNDYIPKLKINRTYKELMTKGVLTSKEKEYARNQMRAANSSSARLTSDKTRSSGSPARFSTVRQTFLTKEFPSSNP